MSASIEYGLGDIKRVVYLKEWEEIIDIFRGIVDEDSRVFIEFKNFQLPFALESIEAKIVKEKLKEAEFGCKVSILRTDIIDKPIVVKVESRKDT